MSVEVKDKSRSGAFKFVLGINAVIIAFCTTFLKSPESLAFMRSIGVPQNYVTIWLTTFALNFTALCIFEGCLLLLILCFIGGAVSREKY